MRDWLLRDGRIFAALTFHGNTKWCPVNLVWLALCWAWSESRCLTDAFVEAATQCGQLLSGSPLSTYQGFMTALVRWSGSFVPLLCRLLHERMEQIGGRWWRIDGWTPIAFDGSRSSVPRTKSNEAALCAANYGSGRTAKYRKKKSKGLRRTKNEKAPPQPPEPQVWITMLWHLGLRLPWLWRLGPSNANERGDVMTMLDGGRFPKKTLFCGDAGFIGYPLWSRLIERRHHFLVRVGGNAHLLTEPAECHFGPPDAEGEVLCWPKTQRQENRPPLRLRLMKVRLGKTRMWMLTSVLDRTQLTPRQVVRFYKMRWGIEVEFRGLKQTLDRARLRCRNDRRLLVELDWSILAMAVAELLALKEQQSVEQPKAKPPFDPAKRSLARTMRALRACLRNLNAEPPPGEDLTSRLRAAVTDDYTRASAKHARYRPPNPDKKPLGQPNLRRITADERETLQNLAA